MLFTPERHERVRGGPYDEAAARDAIIRIAARAERERDPADGRWRLDPDDAVDGRRFSNALYWGAAGVAWALGELAAEGYAPSMGVDREFVEGLETRFADDTEDESGVWWGVAGALAVAEHRWPDTSRRDRILELASASLASPTLEPMEGHPGYMTLAAQLHARTRDERCADFWAAGADRLFDEWRHDAELGAWLWTQRLGSHETRYLGAAHGLAANIPVLLRNDLLDADRRNEVERRTVETLSRLAVVEDGRANWPTGAGDALSIRGRMRVQWCHGAAGILTAAADAAPDDDAWGKLLVAAGRLVWEAGPICDAPGLCHGTAGNAYALLALWHRTRDERWLERARAFAQHAGAQVDERAARLGYGRHSLFTGDEGVALCLASCITGDARFPVVDRLI